MTASILNFPLSNQKADRAFWKGERPRSTEDLRAIGASIIASPEFQAEIAASNKDHQPFCPVSVAIMRGHYYEPADTAPSEMNMDEPA